ncbi:MAG: cytidylate kinase [Hyperthermus sp.]|nr:MAG: cytidylate kinase [Hyperthermus sp.]
MLFGVECASRSRGPVVAVSGPPGSGKTTFARRLAGELGLQYHSAGSIFRELARERGMSVEDLNRAAALDPSIDLEIDQRTVKVACKGNVVIEGHLVAWVVSSIADVKIYVTAPLEVRVERIARREGRSIDEVLRETLVREYTQRARFLQYYGIDVSSLHVFDLVVNTENVGLHEAYKVIMTYTCSVLQAKGYSPRACTNKA